MKKILLKAVVFILTFCISVMIVSKIMNKGNTDMTVEMSDATFPVIFMHINDMNYNEMHGYIDEMAPACMRDTITVIGEDRKADFLIDTYGCDISHVQYEVRSVDGTRLIEDNEAKDLSISKNQISGSVIIKDLIDKNTEYELIFKLTIDSEKEIYYYTRLIWVIDSHVSDNIIFAKQFHEKTFQKTEVQDLARYMETNKDGDNSTLHKVDIHCNLDQLSWGNLSVVKETEESIQVTELTDQITSISMHYLVSQNEDNKKKIFYVEEFYRIRYTKDRMYLLDYERIMDSLFNTDDTPIMNDKVLIGVADEKLPIIESEDGNVFAFIVHNSLYSYNITTNKMSNVFSYYNTTHMDTRTLYNQHDIRVMNIDEGGNIRFIVYGYMNRGTHEGEVGIQIFYYDSMKNTIEEVVYIPYDRTYQMLKAEIDRLIYCNPDNHLYLYLGNGVLDIDLTERTASKVVDIYHDDSMKISENNKMLVYMEDGDLYNASRLVLMDLSTMSEITISAQEEEAIFPLGFMGEDLIYGVARKEDIKIDHSGKTFFPMYVVYIRNAKGEVLKTYEQESIYVTDCIMQNSQIVLTRVQKNEKGSFVDTTTDQIMNRSVEEVGKNLIKPVTTESYGKYIQIAMKKEVNTKTLQVRTPKEVLYEGGRVLLLDDVEPEQFYVYCFNGIEGIYQSPASAVQAAERVHGVVVNTKGDYIWRKGTRAVKNQIMAIEAAKTTDEKNSLVVCLDIMLRYEGMVRNTEILLDRGDTISEILADNLNDAQILDLSGCSLDSVLYYVNMDLPVLVLLQDGSAKIIVGFNQYNIALLDPDEGTIIKAGMNDSADLFKQNGSQYITYIRDK